jgi:hypothetical protein
VNRFCSTSLMLHFTSQMRETMRQAKESYLQGNVSANQINLVQTVYVGYSKKRVFR